MPRDRLATDRLIDAAENADDVLVGADLEDQKSVELRCAICGVPASEARGLPVGYSNPVCEDCDELAVGEDGAPHGTSTRPTKTHPRPKQVLSVLPN